jgi:hypothetical protein
LRRDENISFFKQAKSVALIKGFGNKEAKMALKKDVRREKIFPFQKDKKDN